MILFLAKEERCVRKRTGKRVLMGFRIALGVLLVAANTGSLASIRTAKCRRA